MKFYNWYSTLTFIKTWKKEACEGFKQKPLPLTDFIWKLKNMFYILLTLQRDQGVQRNQHTSLRESVALGWMLVAQPW